MGKRYRVIEEDQGGVWFKLLMAMMLVGAVYAVAMIWAVVLMAILLLSTSLGRTILKGTATILLVALAWFFNGFLWLGIRTAEGLLWLLSRGGRKSADARPASSLTLRRRGAGSNDA